MAQMPLTFFLLTFLLMQGNVCINSVTGHPRYHGILNPKLISASVDVYTRKDNNNSVIRKDKNVPAHLTSAHLGEGRINVISVHHHPVEQSKDLTEFEVNEEVQSLEDVRPALAKAIMDVWKMPSESHFQTLQDELPTPVIERLYAGPWHNFSLSHFVRQNMDNLKKFGDTVGSFLQQAIGKFSHSPSESPAEKPPVVYNHNFTRAHGQAVTPRVHRPRERPLKRKLNPIRMTKVSRPAVDVEDYEVAVWLGFGLGVLFVALITAGGLIVKRLFPRRLTSAISRLPYNRVNNLASSRENSPELTVLFSPLRRFPPGPDSHALLYDFRNVRKTQYKYYM